MMPKRPNSLRLQTYDYALAGAYFVTIVMYNRKSILGAVVSNKLQLRRFGHLVSNIWKDLPNRYDHITLDEFIVMPDHIHGIIWINNPTTIPISTVGAGSLLTSNENYDDGQLVGTTKPAQTNPQITSPGGLPRAGFKSTGNQSTNVPKVQSVNEPAPTGKQSLSEIIRNFKTVSAKRINLLRNTPGTPVWQRNFHDRIIRDEEELNAVRQYIQTNPLRWTLDKEDSP